MHFCATFFTLSPSAGITACRQSDETVPYGICRPWHDHAWNSFIRLTKGGNSGRWAKCKEYSTEMQGISSRLRCHYDICGAQSAEECPLLPNGDLGDGESTESTDSTPPTEGITGKRWKSSQQNLSTHVELTCVQLAQNTSTLSAATSDAMLFNSWGSWLK